MFSLVLLACNNNNVKQDNELKSFFVENSVDGCFALMDNGTGQFTVYNLGWYKDSVLQPASTFKIVNSLIGLQTGKISSDSMVIPWDGVERSITAWNQDLSMREAFRASSVPYYQEVARRIGKDTMETWLTKLGYGARKVNDTVRITTEIDTFWLDNSLKVSPDQQLGLVKQLYFDQLPFFKVHQETVKAAMKMEDTPEYRLGYKTGLSGWDSNTQRRIGWIVGWIEENNHPYFFVLNVESKDPNFDLGPVRLKMLKGILQKLDFMQGKM